MLGERKQSQQKPSSNEAAKYDGWIYQNIRYTLSKKYVGDVIEVSADSIVQHQIFTAKAIFCFV